MDLEPETRPVRERVRVVACTECGCLSGLRWAGWRAYRVENPEFDELPALALYCPTCAARDFEPRGRRR